jgi:hypothetical protein
MQAVNPACNLSYHALFTFRDVEKHTPIERALAWARKLGMNQSAFARAMGVTPQDVTNWKARGMPPEHHAEAARVTHHSIDELVHGIELPAARQAPPPPPRDFHTPRPVGVSDSDWALLQDFTDLPESERNLLRQDLHSKAEQYRAYAREVLERLNREPRDE